MGWTVESFEFVIFFLKSQHYRGLKTEYDRLIIINSTKLRLNITIFGTRSKQNKLHLYIIVVL